MTEHIYYKLCQLYEKVFADKKLSENEFYHVILDSITEVFNVNKVIIWIKNGDKFTPVSKGIDSSFLNDYFSNDYYLEDPFYPDNISNSNSQILTINDVSTKDIFYSSDFYCKCIEPYGMYNSVVLYLRNEKDIFAAVSLIRSKGEGDLIINNEILKNAVSVLTKLSLLFIQRNNENKEKKLFESISNQAPIGIMAFESCYPFEIKYINASFERYISDILFQKRTTNLGNDFIKQYIMCYEFEQFGFCNKIISSSTKRYCLNVMPCQIAKNNNFLLYAYLIPQNSQEESLNLCHIQNYENFTSRQIEIIKLVLMGCSNREISERMFISIYTVKAHLNVIFKELNVRSRLELCSSLTVKYQQTSAKLK